MASRDSSNLILEIHFSKIKRRSPTVKLSDLARLALSKQVQATRKGDRTAIQDQLCSSAGSWSVRRMLWLRCLKHSAKINTG